MYKIVLDAGHALTTAGKQTPDGIKEWSLNDDVCDRATIGFVAYGVEVLRTDHNEGQKDESLATRVAEYLAAGNILCVISVHHNALSATWSNATGTEVYTDNNPTADDTKLANLLATKISAKTGLKNRGVKKAAFTVINQNKVTAVLCEGGFMDGTNDYKVITSAAGKQAYADAIVEAVVEMYDLKKVSTTSTFSKGKEYKVVKTINRYASAADAKAKKNTKGTYEAGTYYIYSKYPDGLNGMYNISKDSTGASAGSWINPSENVVEQQAQTITQQFYRVRKSWDDAKSQKGAFASLHNAKECCQEAGSGYHVFDWNGKIVYSYTAPTVEPTPVPTPSVTPTETVKKAVYDLDYPEKHQIVEYNFVQTEGINEEECTRAIITIKKNNSDFDVEIAKAFFLLADKYHIDPMRAISQSILETGWFKFTGSSVKPEQHNYCGLGATGGGTVGASFDTIENGVRAQLQHLYAYGCKDSLPDGETTIVDPRFKYVTRGVATYWEQLAGRWAVPGFDGDDTETAMKSGVTYGQKIDKIYKQLKATNITDDDINKYFSKPETSDIDNIEVEPNIDDDIKAKTNFIFDFIKKLIEFLFNLLRNN